MPRIRRPAVAGQFYPAHPAQLEAEVGHHLANAIRLAERHPVPKAVIVPHAGYVYSGPVAGASFAQVARRRDEVERVVLLGPSHRVWLEGLAVPSADVFETPLGPIQVDREALEHVLELPQVQLLDAAHVQEHSLEVQLPFLQRVLGSFRLAPFSVGKATPAEVAEVLERLWGGPETLIVISSDLSHYHPYATAQRYDAATTRAIEALDGDEIRADGACGHVPVAGLLLAARRHGLSAHTLDVRNSGDTAGPRDQVVGYGAWALA